MRKKAICVLVTVFVVWGLDGKSQPQTPRRPKLKAVAQDELHIPFVIDEKNLRKLSEIARGRLSQVAHEVVVNYRVEFSDHSYYDTDSLETVLAEENPFTREITGIQVYASPASPSVASPTSTHRQVM
jgi:hypothetical protein